MAGLRAPLSTLHCHPHGKQRMTRGQRRSLLFHCGGLPPPTPCRFCRRTTRVTACTLAPSPYFVTASPKTSTVSLPPQLLRLHPAGIISPGGTLTHWKAPPSHGAPRKPTVAEAVLVLE